MSLETERQIAEKLSSKDGNDRGSPQLRLLFSMMLALVVSILGTLQHQTQLGTEAPIGLIFGLSLVFMGAASIRDSNSKKGPVLSYAAALAIFVFVFGQNFTGDVLIPNNGLGLYWSYGSIGVAMLVALWPKLKR